jgi:putative flippase GtrA
MDTQRLTSEAKRVARFLVVGSGGLAVDSSVFLALNSHGVDRPVARAISLVAATFITWQLNRLFTFGASKRSRREELARYSFVAAGAQGFNYLLFLFLSSMAPQAQPLLLIGVCAAAAAVFSFAGQRAFTFAGAPIRSF